MACFRVYARIVFGAYASIALGAYAPIASGAYAPIASGAYAPIASGAYAPSDAVVVLRCEVRDDPQARVYELHRSGEGTNTAWSLVMRSREAADSPVRLPLRDAAPVIAGDRVTLDYQTQNGGRDIEWRVTPCGATLDVHANFELEVNIEPDLDPRVERMNTNGVLSNLSCSLSPSARRG